ncbi:helix-turn-helix domain-containing protein [uncultured Roseibium sp.]|uniref:helix-turn-helix domain-containing protein n=1 Tax=uncultured Roseibium sp. TaxID=1936171 RepID=UPI00261B63E9|nr:helix-turn-helix domain-containing protein [uncultured Roseibium sp.]
MDLSQHMLVLISTMAMTVPLFGALCCLLQDRHKTLFRVLAAFFLAAAVTELPTALQMVVTGASFVTLLEALWLLAMACVTPLIWLYVWILTSEDEGLPEKLYRHLVLPGFTLLTSGSIVLYLVLADLRLFSVSQETLLQAADAINWVFWALVTVVIKLQWGVYILLVYRRLVSYRIRLKDLFASTESKELRWIAFVVGISGFYWILSLISSLLSYMIPDYSGLPRLAYFLLNLTLQTIMAVWGLRQRPGLRPQENVARVPEQRYANSALTEDATDRIAAKLRKAMTADKLYLNPNLSLWILARHTGVSENYISQVLNEVIGQNFFDFVNSHRIEAAKSNLRDSDDTILAIALDAGFNSRSSFYSAFKKVTGQTPTAYRKAQGTVDKFSTNLSV